VGSCLVLLLAGIFEALCVGKEGGERLGLRYLPIIF
jgi:hypothetical protein